MRNLTYEVVVRNPERLEKLLRNARRERAEAVHRAIASAFRKLLSLLRRPATRRTLQISGCS